MKHVAVAVNEETSLFDVVLKFPAFNPIGPRLEKGLRMPTCQTAAITTVEEALKNAAIIDDWLTRQEEGERTSSKKSEKPQVDHYGPGAPGYKLEAEKPKAEPVKLAPPPPKPAPVEKKEFIPEPFDA